MIYESFSDSKLRAFNNGLLTDGNSLFQALSNPVPDAEEIDRAPDSGGVDDSAAAREVALQAALERLVEAHTQLAAERAQVARQCELETIRWLSALISGIAPQISRALMLSTIEEATTRVFTRCSPGPIRIRVHPDIANALLTTRFARDGVVELHIEEDADQTALSVLASWEDGSFAFDAAAAIESLSLMLKENIVDAAKWENEGEFKQSE